MSANVFEAVSVRICPKILAKAGLFLHVSRRYALAASLAGRALSERVMRRARGGTG